MTDRPRSAWQSPAASPGFLLWQVTLAWQRAMRAALAPHDLTHVQFVLLATLWWLGESGQRPTQQALAEAAGTDSMMTSQVLRKLADRGLVSREPDPADARAKLLAPTKAGRTLLAAALADVEQADLAYFAPLGDQHSSFVDGLALLTADQSL